MPVYWAGSFKLLLSEGNRQIENDNQEYASGGNQPQGSFCVSGCRGKEIHGGQQKDNGDSRGIMGMLLKFLTVN